MENKDKPAYPGEAYPSEDGLKWVDNRGLTKREIVRVMVEPSESQEEIAGIVTKGQFIDLTAVAEHAHSEGKKEGINETLDKVIKILSEAETIFMDESRVFEELKQLKR